jgi:precorrin-2/cobalt-factor-2 C20-methyltransferase
MRRSWPIGSWPPHGAEPSRPALPYAYPTCVRKSSVYLPDDLKADLAELSHRSGRSEAELIRGAIERVVRTTDEAPMAVAGPPVAPGPGLVGVGVGPGDPGLVTSRALEVLRAADTVLAATTATDAIGRAETVVRAAAPDVAVDRLVIAIGDDADARSASLTRAAVEVVARVDRGELVAMVVLGDPNVFSVFPRVADAVRSARPGLAVDTVPGIMGFQALAAETATVLADGDDELALVSLGPSADRLAALLDDPHRTVVVYKGGRHLPSVAAALGDRGRLTGAVMGELLGLPGARTGPVADAAERPASYLATVIVPARRDES